MTFDDILKQAVELQASDIHLKVGVVPVIRRYSQLQPLNRKSTPLTARQIESMIQEALNEDEIDYLYKHKELDKSYELPQIGRFRVNVFRQRGSTRFVVRVISQTIPTLKELNMPDTVARLADLERGLILVTGVTGSGKTTTLASMIDYINQTKHMHIITLEDPIEYFIKDRKSIISQRELGSDMDSFSGSLRASLRQDPDVILVGEMRDRATMETALLAAETGHLVLSTLHTLDAAESVNRIIAQFPPRQQEQIRRQIAQVLRAVISQRLLQKKEGTGLVPAVEILVNNQRIKEMILDPYKTHLISEAILESAKESGMCTFDQSLLKLVVNNQIGIDEALKYTSHRDNFLLRLKGIQSGKGSDWQENIEAFNKIPTNWDNVDELTLETDRGSKKR